MPLFEAMTPRRIILSLDIKLFNLPPKNCNLAYCGFSQPMYQDREKQLLTELELWSEEFPELWRKERRVEFLEQKVLDAYDKMVKKRLELRTRPQIWKYFSPMCDGPFNFDRYYLPDLIKAWFDHMFYGVSAISGDDLVNLIRQKLKTDYQKAKADYVRAYARLGIFKGTITFEGSLTEEEIERAKVVRIDKLIENGHSRVRGGRQVFLCPFHMEKTPSFVVYADNSFHCFGCSAHGFNAINFIMKKENLNFKDAVLYLNQYA